MSEKPISYWEKMEAYKKLKLDTSLSWHKLYDDERKKREEIEAKYEALTKKLRETAYYEKLEGLAKDAGEQWEEHMIDYGVGPRGVQHKLK